MLISAPFLPPRRANEADDAYLDRCMVLGGAGDGSFPVSADMNWHGGVHLTAPGTRPDEAVVRAIADGTVQFVRAATPRSSDPAHPLNYRGGWTDDGCIVLRHETDIGFDTQGNRATRLTFFSIYMHLSTVAPLAVGARVFRKDELGAAGSLHGTARRIHFEIVCDDDNIRALTGTNDATKRADGRWTSGRELRRRLVSMPGRDTLLRRTSAGPAGGAACAELHQHGRSPDPARAPHGRRHLHDAPKRRDGHCRRANDYGLLSQPGPKRAG